MPGNHGPVDAERLAAMMDGRTDERGRDEALASLAASGDTLAGYSDALAVTAELEAEDARRAQTAGAAAPPRPPSVRARWRRPMRVLALAAGVAALAAAPWLWSRASGSGPRDPAQLAVLVQADGLPRGWEGRAWSPTRDAADPLTPGARASRLGARLVDLELAARAGDASAGPIAAEVLVLLQGLPASGPAQAVYRDVQRRAGEPPGTLDPLLERGSEAVARLAGTERVEAGAWAEAARLAAARQDARFFRARASRAALERIAGDAGTPAPARAAAGRLRDLPQGNGAPDWQAVQREATALLRALASG
jgi:hypothetical protein